jgi:hypothetical protein
MRVPALREGIWMTISLSQAANLIGSGRQTLLDWAKDDLLPLAGNSNPKALDCRGLLLAALIQNLRHRGIALSAIRPIVEFLRSFSEDAFTEEIQRGNSLLLCRGPGLEPQLLPFGSSISVETKSDVAVMFDLASAWTKVTKAATQASRPSLVFT